MSDSKSHPVPEEFYYKADYRPDTPYVSSYSEARKIGFDKLDDIGQGKNPWEWAEEVLKQFEEDHVPPEVDGVFAPEKDEDEYSLVTKVDMRGNRENYIPVPTRNISTLKDYETVEKAPETDKWGGLKSKKYEATGNFHIVHDDGRFWMVDPEGHPCYNAGISDVSCHNSPNTLKNALSKYGSEEKWAQSATSRIKELGFTAVGMWSDESLIHQAETPIGICGTAYFITTYGDHKGLTEAVAGHKTFGKNNTMPVFNPDFEDFAEDYAREVTAGLKDSPDLVGWFSDNELPANLNLLERYLTLDPNQSQNQYSLAVAWTFLKQQTCKGNPKIEDATEEMRQLFRGVVYNRYFRIVSQSLKKVDPNHMYLGCRLMYMGPRFVEGTILGENMMCAAGHWCDAISINYYLSWTADSEIIKKWAEWSGKPLIASEWYAMAYDSGLSCETGAGFRVKTQADRGRFYQNYTLQLLECPWFVGFHWFKYMDNDPNDSEAEASNLNSNKGIVSTEYEEWTDLTDSMKELNDNIYPLIDFFDNRNGL